MAIPTQISTYVENYFIPKFVDVVTTFDPLFERLWKAKKTQTGGTGVDQPLHYGQSGNVGTYKAHGTYRREVTDTRTYASFSWKHYYANVLVSRVQGLMAKGKSANITTLIKDQIEDGELALKDRLHYDIVGNGAAYAWPNRDSELLEPIEGLKKILTVDNTYGGIDASSDLLVNGIYLWNPQEINGNDTTYANLYTKGQNGYLPQLLQKMFTKLTNGSDRPTLVIMPEVIFNGLWQCSYDKAEASKFRETTIGSLGFQALEFERVPCIMNKNMTLGEFYVINESYLHLWALAGAALNWTGFDRTDGDDDMGQILLSMAMTCSNRRRQGRVYGLPTSY